MKDKTRIAAGIKNLSAVLDTLFIDPVGMGIVYNSSKETLIRAIVEERVLPRKLMRSAAKYLDINCESGAALWDVSDRVFGKSKKVRIGGARNGVLTAYTDFSNLLSSHVKMTSSEFSVFQNVLDSQIESVVKLLNDSNVLNIHVLHFHLIAEGSPAAYYVLGVALEKAGKRCVKMLEEWHRVYGNGDASEVVINAVFRGLRSDG